MAEILSEFYQEEPNPSYLDNGYKNPSGKAKNKQENVDVNKKGILFFNPSILNKSQIKQEVGGPQKIKSATSLQQLPFSSKQLDNGYKINIGTAISVIGTNLKEQIILSIISNLFQTNKTINSGTTKNITKIAQETFSVL
ncbi:hypothetical protein PPERSA_06355 [Pseudocohnilembus persalinus]|uniref:Uncharacterized protein n=1 Tax=Pseudocohnilembus persalinus TaxID=266149 RepID=A0A0V0QJJ4_PSEPJ|nr:hypothetical protein PPERSA_06355 [Pseudocohnilembus persalinus]|eukprot:KRX02160.1 hypothetical protein PPERSA_06355 [Pseudocohnilembus persalinus]